MEDFPMGGENHFNEDELLADMGVLPTRSPFEPRPLTDEYLNFLSDPHHLDMSLQAGFAAIQRGIELGVTQEQIRAPGAVTDPNETERRTKPLSNTEMLQLFASEVCEQHPQDAIRLFTMSCAMEEWKFREAYRLLLGVSDDNLRRQGELALASGLGDRNRIRPDYPMQLATPSLTSRGLILEDVIALDVDRFAHVPWRRFSTDKERFQAAVEYFVDNEEWNDMPFRERIEVFLLKNLIKGDPAYSKITAVYLNSNNNMSDAIRRDFIHKVAGLSAYTSEVDGAVEFINAFCDDPQEVFRENAELAATSRRPHNARVFTEQLADPGEIIGLAESLTRGSKAIRYGILQDGNTLDYIRDNRHVLEANLAAMHVLEQKLEPGELLGRLSTKIDKLESELEKVKQREARELSKAA